MRSIEARIQALERADVVRTQARPRVDPPPRREVLCGLLSFYARVEAEAQGDMRQWARERRQAAELVQSQGR